ncbi:titin-like [Patiria miniata]|uniref:Titin-like n=1 Tax=Patiria miniata TaxID=46514 RepID=A0A913Z9K1_PATMI|nr:titin-like [Patiria miniata]
MPMVHCCNLFSEAEVTVEVMQSERSVNIELEGTAPKEAVSFEISGEEVVSIEDLPSEDKAVVIRTLPTQPAPTEEKTERLLSLPEEELEMATTIKIAPSEELEAEELEVFDESRPAPDKKPGDQAVTVDVGKKPSVIRVESLERAPLPVRERMESYPEEELSEASVVKLVPEREDEAEELPREELDRAAADQIKDISVDKATKKTVQPREAPEEVSLIQPRKPLESMTEEELQEAVTVQLAPTEELEAEEITPEQPAKLRPQKSVEEVVPLDQVDKQKVSVIRGPAEVEATSSVPIVERLGSVSEEELAEATTKAYIPEDIEEAAELPKPVTVDITAEEIAKVDVTVGKVSKKKPALITATPQEIELTITPTPDTQEATVSLKRLGSVIEEELREAAVKPVTEKEEEAESFVSDGVPEAVPEELPSEAADKVGKKAPSVRTAPEEVSKVKPVKKPVPLREEDEAQIDVVYERTEYLDIVEEEDLKEASTQRLPLEKEGEAEEFEVGKVPEARPEEVPSEDVSLEMISKKKPTPVREAPEEVKLPKPRPKLDSYEEEELQEAAVVTVGPEVVEESEVLPTEITEEYSPETATASVDRASKKQVPLRDAPEEVKLQRPTARMASVDEEDLKEAVSISVAPQKEEEAEILVELSKPEETMSESLPSVDVSLEVSKKPTFVREAPEEAQVRRPIAKMDSVEEEELREAVTVRVAPRKEEDVDLFTPIEMPEEVAPVEEDRPDTIRERKPVVISHPYEPEPEYMPTRELLETLPEEQLETALTARIIPRDEFKAETLTTEEVSPAEATPDKAPVEITLDFGKKPLVHSMPGQEKGPQLLEEVEGIVEEDLESQKAEATPDKTPVEITLDFGRKPLVHSMPGQEKGPQLLEEVEGIVEEDLESQKAVEVVVEEEEIVVELPVAPVITDKFKSKASVDNNFLI